MVRRGILLSALLSSGLALHAQAGVYDRAARIFKRIAQVPPTAEQLTEMVGHLSNTVLTPLERDARAAEVAIKDKNFYNVSLVTLFMPSSNRERSSEESLNDAVALNIGIVRDNIPYDQVLYEDHYYKGADSGAGKTVDLHPPVNNPQEYSWKPLNNNHYERLQELRVDLSDNTRLIKESQKDWLFNGDLANIKNTAGEITDYVINDRGMPDIAGVISTRASASAFFSAGTNRRMFRFLLINYLCNDLEDIKDNTVADQFIRRDVDRMPGGSAKTFQMHCKGCHAIQDAAAGAFSYFDFRFGMMTYLRGPSPDVGTYVQYKVTQNYSVYPDGHLPQNDSWTNTLVTSADPTKVSQLGWRGNLSGTGANSLGKALAKTRAFSSCQVKKVFKHVCLRAPQASESKRIDSIADQFEGEWKYNFKNLFKAVVNVCL